MFSVLGLYLKKFGYKVLLIYQKLLVTKLLAMCYPAKNAVINDKNELTFAFVNVINFPDGGLGGYHLMVVKMKRQI